MNIPAFLNRFSPRDWTVEKDAFTSSTVVLVANPMPPPPAVAFSITGKPSLSLSFTASCSFLIKPWEPGTTGTSALTERSLAVCFKPNDSMLSGLGPTHTLPAAATARAKSAFSDRNP